MRKKLQYQIKQKWEIIIPKTTKKNNKKADDKQVSKLYQAK